MKKISVLISAIVLALTGCASGGPKTVLIKNSLTPDQAAIVHPSMVPGGFMIIRGVDGKSTYVLSIGYLGSIYVPPGEHEFEVEVTHGFKVQDAGGPAWTLPQGVTAAPLESVSRDVVFVSKGVSKPHAKLEAGKVYEIKFGFDRANKGDLMPVTWVSEIPN